MSASNVELVSVSAIVCPPQVRQQFNQDALSGLAQTVRELGIQQPLLVRRVGDKLILTDGARRLAAAKAAGLTKVPVIIDEESRTEADVIQRQLIANCQREDLTPLEKAAAIGDLISKYGWSASQVAAKLGMSNAMVTRLTALLTLPENIRQKVASGELTASAAYELSRVKDASEQADLAKRAVSGELTRDAISGVNKHPARGSAKPSAVSTSRVTAKLASGRSVTVAASSLTLDSFIETLEEVLARARQARPKGLALTTFLKVLRDQSK